MLTSGELRSMEGALSAYRAYMAATRREAAKTVLFAPGATGIVEVDSLLWFVNEAVFSTSARASEIVEAQETNLRRFIDLRNELVEMEPGDHEAVLRFVEGVRRISGSTLPKAMAAERESSDVGRIVGGAVADTAEDVAHGIAIGLPILFVAVIGAAVLYVMVRGK